MATMKHVNPDDIRTLFSRAMSDMYRAETPQYGALLELVADVNDETLRRDPDLKASLERASKASIQRRMEQVEASIERYMAALETVDRQDGELAPANSVRLKDKIAALKAQMQAFKAHCMARHHEASAAQ
jgi:Domain of unknown function (DUF1338)